MAHPWAKAGAAQRVRAKTNMDVRSFITLPALHRSYARQRGAAVGDSKKRVELVALKAAVEQVQEEYAFSQRRACGVMTMAVSSYRYQTRRWDEPLRTRLVELAREKPRFGYRRLQVLLRRNGERVNHKRVHRVYREAGLSLRRKKRKHCVRVRATAAGLDGGEPGVGAGLRARCGGLRAGDPGAECGGRVHPGMFGLGSRHQFREPKGDASAGCDRGRARAALGDPL